MKYMKHLTFTLFLLTFSHCLLRAQPDPSTVYAWFMADAGVLTNASGNVTNWLNQAVTGTPALRNLNLPGAAPTWIPAAVGSNPVVRFSGTANIFAAAGSFGTIATDRTVVACFKLSGTSGGFLFDGSTHSGMNRAQIRAGSWQVGIQPSPIGNSGNADPATFAILPDAWQTHFFNFEPVTGGTRITHSMFNGASVTYTNLNTNGLGGLILGENASQNLGLAADIGEVLVYDRSLTTNEQQALGAYLTNKWRVTALPPPTATDVYAWYAGDSLLNVSGDNYSVTSWSNLGTAATNATYTKTGRDLINLTSAPQKIYLRFADNSPAGAVRFDGNDGIWAAKGVWGILTNNRTITILARISNSVPQGFLFDSTSTAPGYTRALVQSNNWQVSTTSGTGTVTTNVTTGVWQVHSFVVSTNSDAIQHFIDGAQAGSVAISSPSYLSGLMIGANVSQASGIWADVAECLVFNTALDDPARTSVENYLVTKWAGVTTDTNPPTPPAYLPFVRVFTGGVDGYTCFRIPAIVTTANGTLIAMSDGRIGSCGDIPTPLDLVIKRSFDHGTTWGPLQVVTDYGSNPSDVDDYPAYGLTGISRVSSGDAALLLDRTNGRIWTLYDNGGVLSGARKIKLEMKYSDDDGVTWSPRIDVEAANPGIRPSGGEFIAGPGNGIQITEGPHAGRLIFPVYHYKTPALSMVIYSDDHGATWTRGAAAGTGGGESQVAETPGGGLIISMRDNNFSWSGVRTFARSTDAGETWGVPYTDTVIPPTMADPACQGNIYRLTTTNDSNASRLIHANAASASGRVNMTLRVSYDEGQTWPVSNQVYAAGSAYSSVTKLANGDIGLLFEKDPYGNLDYARRSIFEITGGADSLPAYDVWAGQQFTPAQLSNPVISGPDADADGDGRTNFEEFMAGTDPLSAASFLQLNIAPAGGGTQLSFSGVSNKSYTIQSRDSPNSGSWTGFTNVNTLPSNITISVPVAATNDKRFFRLATPQLP